MKKRRISILSAMALAAALGMTGCSGGQKEEPAPGQESGSQAGETAGEKEENKEEKKEETPVVLKMSEQNSETSINAVWADYLAEKANEYSGGSLTIEVYYSNSLASFDIESVISGIADIIQMEPSTQTDLCSAAGALSAPFIYKDREHYEKVMAYGSDVLNYFNQQLEGTGVVFIGGFNAGDRNITCNKAVHKPEDLSGMKIRVVQADNHMALFKALGAQPTPMNFSEVPAALMTNVIDGQENPISVIASNKLYELQDYCIMDGHMPTTMGLWINENSFDSLSDNQREALIKAADDAMVYMHDYIEEKTDEWIKECQEGGMEFIDEESGLDTQAFHEIAEKMYEDFSEEWKDMPELIRAAGE